MLGMKNHFDIRGSIEIREVDIMGVACINFGPKNAYSVFDPYTFFKCFATTSREDYVQFRARDCSDVKKPFIYFDWRLKAPKTIKRL